MVGEDVMESATMKCPGCGAGLEFDPKQKKMICSFCKTGYGIMELRRLRNGTAAVPGNGENGSTAVPGNGTNGTANQGNPGTENRLPAWDDEEYLNLNVYRCSSCGAEMMTTDTEVSGFCSYCGQSTVLFDRISREYKPDYILPFSITKEEALDCAVKRLEEAICMPDEVRNIKTESVCGIYMPYWIYNGTLKMKARCEVRTGAGNGMNKAYEKVLSETAEIPMDASERYSDYTSAHLNPYPLAEKKPFLPEYLAGFYADRRDVSQDVRENEAREIMKEDMLRRWMATLSDLPSREMTEMYAELYKATKTIKTSASEERYELHSVRYVLLPVYFITFRLKDEPVILLVNGCTGRLVGGVPADERKLKRKQRRTMLAFAGGMGLIGAALIEYTPIVWGGLLMAILGGSTVFVGIKAKKRYEEMMKHTNSKEMFAISKNRQ